MRKAILEAMADDSSLAILSGTTFKARSAAELIREFSLPSSTVYRRIEELEKAGLLTIEHIILTPDGKKFSIYRSTVRDMRAEYKSGKVEVTVSPNEDVLSKLTRLWGSMRE
jgi:DNA-binding Lrp family transcriptional regulator